MIFGTIDAKGNTETTLECNLNELPSSNPLAFGYGISRGQQYLKGEQKHMPDKINHGSKWSELAPEYIRGFLFGYRSILVAEGTKIKKGQERCYALLDKNIIKE